MSSKLRDLILAVCDIQKEIVEVPEWDCKVEVRGMTLARRVAFLEQSIDKNGKVDPARYVVGAVIASAYDPETGEAIFSYDDMPSLLEKSSKALQVIADAALALSGMGAKVEEEASKN